MYPIKNLLLIFAFFTSTILYGQSTHPYSLGLGEYAAFIVDNSTHRLYNCDGTPEPGLASTNIIGASAGFHHFAAVSDDGYAWSRGQNDLGQCGIGTTTNVNNWTRIATDANGNPFNNVVEATCWVSGGSGILFRKSDGTIWICGDTRFGMRGNGTDGAAVDSRPVQIPIPGGRFIVQVAISDILLLRASDGTVWACGGNNAIPTLGTNDKDYKTLHQVVLPQKSIDIATSGKWSYSLGADNKLYGWGYWTSYLGIGNSGFMNQADPPTVPVDLTNELKLPYGVINIATNSIASYAILSDNSLWAWGSNATGTMGNGTEINYATYNPIYNWSWEGSELMQQKPAQVLPGKNNWANYLPDGAADVFYMWALDATGQLYSWGRNKAGVLGNQVQFAGDGDIEAIYPNSLDQPTATPVNPIENKKLYKATCPYCIVNPSGSPCNTFKIPNNKAPVANAGPDQATNNADVMLTAAASSDADGIIVYYKWVKVSGPAGDLIQNATSQTTRVYGLTTGVYTYQLQVTDNGWTKVTDEVVITVGTVAPAANAGTDQTITLPVSSVKLDGTASTGPVTSYTWTKVSGPTAFTITSASSATTTVTGLTEGVYVFKLTVNGGSSSTVQVTVNAAVNQQPIANAGANRVITLPADSVKLTGSGTDADGTISGYAWTKISGPSCSIESPSSAITNVTGLNQGIYELQLEVTDNKGAKGTALVTITVNAAPVNKPPVANAGSNQTIVLPLNTVNLNGSGSDADGTVSGYAWTKISGPACSIESPSSAATKVTGLIQGVYQFQLEVTDNKGAKGTATVTITVNAAPVNQLPIANPGSNQTITLPLNTITLNGSGSDADGTISGYAWTKISGPFCSIESPSSAITKITGLSQGVYQLQLEVTDNKGAKGTAIVKITVNAAPVNQPPVANAGSNQTIILPLNTITLNGSGSDADGTVSAFKWTKISGPAGGSISDVTNPAAQISAVIEGVYKFQLEVTDDKGAIGADIVTITVNAASIINQAPIADAGSNQIISLPTNAVNLVGSGADIDGNIVSYSWTKTSGPAEGNIGSPANATTSITALTEGVYLFQLEVTDNKGAKGTDLIRVTVNAALVNQAPVAYAGANLEITLPLNYVTLNGSGSDADGSIADYSWTKLSGPAGSVFNNANNASTTITELIEGVYQFQLEVTDDDGATATSLITVTVKPLDINQTPVADAGANIDITLPLNNVTLSGSGRDNDGNIVSYSWVKISGSTAGTIVDPTNAATLVTGLIEGSYKFQLTVTDNEGSSASSIVTVVVHPALNNAPVANAGPDLNITAAASNIDIDGSGSYDPDGNIVSYSWAKISGPGDNVIIQNSTSAKATISSLLAGVYEFELTVTDNSGASSKDVVRITVSEIVVPVNQPPVANAGPDLNITLPSSDIVIDGSGSYDPDGSIVSYSWAKISGPSVVIQNSTSAKATISSLLAGVYEFELTVTDNSGASSKAVVKITVSEIVVLVNQPPVANAGPDLNITAAASNIDIDGSGSYDPDGNIVSYSWAKISGPGDNVIIQNSTSAKATISSLLAGAYEFELTVTDNSGASSKDVVRITVSEIVVPVNQPPVANAGPDLNITLPSSDIVIDGSGSYDPDGSIVSYSWAKISGPSVVIQNSTSAKATISSLLAGVYEFELTVTDNSGASSKAVVKITVSEIVVLVNQPPVANAGPDLNITLPSSDIVIDGSGSYDPDGSIVSYSWAKISGPSVVIQNSSSGKATISSLLAGVYEFELTVTDNSGASSKAVVKITVSEIVVPVNQPPVANAGPDLKVTLPSSDTVVDGSGSYDPDGSIVSYSWVKISGPNPTTILNSTSSKATIATVLAGEYEFELTVTDNQGATSKDLVKVIVTGIMAQNQNPVANAGDDVSVSLPVSTITLDGSKSIDADGSLVNYSWKQLGGAPDVVITSQNSVKPVLTNLLEGEYIFELTVTDNNGAISKDEVKVIVINTLRVTNSLLLYPNPVRDMLKVRYTSDRTGKMKMMIYDVSGIIVKSLDLEKSSTIFETSLDVSSLTPGSYIIQIESSDGKKDSRKFIKL